MKKINFCGLTDKQILDLPIKKLVAGRVRLFSKELKSKLQIELLNKNIYFKPHIWASTEWFSPDGAPGFAYPFYLADKRLKKIYLTHFFEIEGKNQAQLMKLARHECGHAIDNAFGLRRLKKRQELFGKTSTRYPESYKPNKNISEYIENLGEDYGQAHPDEDWAETFAFWLSGQKFDSEDPVQIKKYYYLKNVMEEKVVNHQAKYKPNYLGMDNALDMDMTFREFILERKNLLKVKLNLSGISLEQKSKTDIFHQVKCKNINFQESHIISRNIYDSTDFFNKNSVEPNSLLIEELICSASLKKFGLDRVIM